MTREVAIEWLKRDVSRLWDTPMNNLHKEALNKAIEALEQKSRKGYWITLKDEWGDIHEAVCSCCDANGNHKWRYCPNCGAKMEVEE